jgi:hypothetical protein
MEASHAFEETSQQVRIHVSDILMAIQYSRPLLRRHIEQQQSVSWVMAVLYE